MRWNHLQQVVFCLWALAIEVAVVIGLGGAILLSLSHLAKAHIAGHPEWTEWLAAQKTPDTFQTSCCDRSDSYLLDDEDVRVRDGEYEGRINGKWITFPNKGQGNAGNTVLGAVGNPTGGSIAWVYNGRPYCFAPGTGT